LEVYGKNAVSERTTHEWFARFRFRNQDVKDASRPGRPITEKYPVKLCNWWSSTGKQAVKK